jgi:hypothetical protein
MSGAHAQTAARGLWVMLMLISAAIRMNAATQESGSEELLRNPGFEIVSEGRARGWSPFELGYELVTGAARTGAHAVRCANADMGDRRGATAVVELSQTRPLPILIQGWSRAENVGGFRNNDYAVYVDLEHTDGTPLWGQTAPFSVGTHGWEHRRVLVFPTKPIRRLHVHALFRHHTGTVWFDDFSVRQLTPGGTFDGQEVAAPRLSSGVQSGWFVRDMTAETPYQWIGRVPLGRTRAIQSLHVTVRAVADTKTRSVIRVQDSVGKPRCLSVCYVERVPAGPVRWWYDIRRSVPCAESGEYANLTRINVGATGMMSLYPLGCITGRTYGKAIGLDPLQGPTVARIGYHASSRLLYLVFDVALLPDNVRNSREGHGFADLGVVRWQVDPAWGFRSAVSGYYAMFPEAFDRRAKKEGIWIPFTDPATVKNVADFGVAYHEGDNSIASDDRLGILSFRYTEPMTWWMPMAPDLPRTYETALDILKSHLTGSNAHNRGYAQAVMNSGSKDPSGAFNVEFQNAPWTNGAVWALNPNPALPHPPGEHTKATLSYTPSMADRMYGAQAPGVQDGEYLDSIEGWADVLDFRLESLRHSSVPVTFTTDGTAPVVPTWFSVWEMARYMRDDLRRRAKLLMANATPWRIHAFAPLLDVMGTEVNWLPEGVWRPDSDTVLSLRRTLAFRKPYLLLQNTDFDRFGSEYVQRYFERCMFYAVFPSMFSVDAATRNYWTQPQWYERDRALFRRYIPVISALSSAGWEPITLARTDADDVFVERYGRSYFTVMNDGAKSRSFRLIVPSELLGRSDGSASLINMLDGSAVQGSRTGNGVVFTLELQPGACVALKALSGTSPRP